MRVITLTEWRFVDGAYKIVREEGFDYSGIWARCDRGQSTQAFNQSEQQSATSAADAQQALGATNTALGQYSNNLNKFMQFGRQTYGANGEFMKDANTEATTAAAAGNTALKGNLALNAMRTGENTASYAPTVAASQQQSEQSLTNTLASADQQRLAALTGVETTGLQASQFPATVQAGLYGGANTNQASNQSSATSAASVPSGWQVFGGDLASAVGSAAGAYCPAEGSVIRMADGTDKLVEDLRKGDWLYPFSGVNPPNEVLADPVLFEKEAWELETKGGRRHAGSETHTVALATGGYALMPEMLDKTVMCEFTGDLVTAVRPIGKRRVYQLTLGGSHCYMADGICILS